MATVRRAIPSGPRPDRRAVPWAELPPPARLVILFTLTGGSLVFLSGCVALSYWLLHVAGVVG